MEAFRALSFRDKWRVSRAVYRGEAPADPRHAAAAVALAESYQRQRISGVPLRMLAIAVVVLMTGLCVWAIVDGEALRAVLWGSVALVNGAQFALNPATRPARVARSLAASRQLVGPDATP